MEPIAPNNTIVHGWVQQPNTRGTLDILWTCAVTVTLCAWSTQSPNVPGPTDGQWRIFGRKIYLALLCLLEPETILINAVGQWSSARRSVREFHAAGYTKWTMTHAFFFDMGGMVFQAQNWKPFPIDAKQAFYLASRGYISFDDIVLDKEYIDDKNKKEGIARFITLVQIVWFVINSLGRFSQKLAVTTLELTTLGFILCTLAISYFWAHKPSEVSKPAIVRAPNHTIETILLEADGPIAARPYKYTPLDFASRQEWPWNLYFSNWVNICWHMGLRFRPFARPVDFFPHDNFREVSHELSLWVFVFHLAYTGVTMAGWNFTFPTHTELVLWRVMTTISSASVAVFIIIDRYNFYLYPRLMRAWAKWKGDKASAEAPLWGTGLAQGIPLPQWNKTGSRKEIEDDLARQKRETRERRKRMSPLRRALHDFAESLRNNSHDNDPLMELPLRCIVPASALCFFYCSARGYILLEDFLNLRGLPASAYINVNWTEFLPHF